MVADSSSFPVEALGSAVNILDWYAGGLGDFAGLVGNTAGRCDCDRTGVSGLFHLRGSLVSPARSPPRNNLDVAGIPRSATGERGCPGVTPDVFLGRHRKHRKEW